MNPRGFVSALFASKLRLVLVGVVIVGAVIGGAFALGVLGVPGIADIDNTFGAVTDEATTIETDLIVSNPNPVGVGLQGVSVNYTVSMNSIEMAHGTKNGVSIGPGNSTIDLETQLRNEAIPPWWVSHIRNDERTTIEIDATVTSGRLGRGTDITRTHEIETDLVSAFNSEETRPVNADSPLTDDPVLYINETRGEWGTVSESETPIDMAFVVYNPNLEPYVITELGYEITMNGVDLGDGRTDREHVIGSYSSETIGLTTTIDNQRLDEWWVTHLDSETYGHQVSELRIDFYAVIELPTGDEIRVPLDELTYEETLTTDIFDEGGDVGTPTGSANDGSEDQTDSGADSEGTDGTTDGTDNETTDGTTDGTDNETTDGDGSTDEEEDDGLLVTG